MYKLCKTEQSTARQRQLEMGLLAAMQKKRYEDITISDLCEQLGVPRKSFYRYFSSKDGALYALIDHTLVEFQLFHDPYLPGEERTLQKDLEGFFLFWLQRRSFVEALNKSGLTGILVERAIRYANAEAFPGRFLPGETRVVQTHVVSFSVCGLMSMMVQWHQEGFRNSAADMARVATRLLSQPLFPYVEQVI